MKNFDMVVNEIKGLFNPDQITVTYDGFIAKSENGFNVKVMEYGVINLQEHCAVKNKIVEISGNITDEEYDLIKDFISKNF
ncbi:MAG: hypothetical protein ACRCXT_03280 [Paraclostridium sp.]